MLHLNTSRSASSTRIANKARTTQTPLTLSDVVDLFDDTTEENAKVETKSVTRSPVSPVVFSTKLSSSVIAVPGYNTAPVNTWGLPREFQQAASSSSSTNSLSRLHMYTFQPNFKSTGDFTWKNFLQTGIDLAEELARLAIEVC